MLSLIPDKNAGTFNFGQLNGVTTFDLLLIQRHILYSSPFTSPFQCIAADVNSSGSVNVADMLIIKRILLDPNNFFFPAGNWRFIPQYCFENANFNTAFFNDYDLNTPSDQANPFSPLCSWTNPDETNGLPRLYKSNNSTIPNVDSWMDHISINPNGFARTNHIPWSFRAVKSGDVNCNADPEFLVTDGNDDLFISSPHSPILDNSVFILNIRAIGNRPSALGSLGSILQKIHCKY